MVVSIETILRRSVVIAPIIIVVVLAAVAIFSLLDPNGESEDASLMENPAPPGRAFPGQRFQVDDATFPLSIGCVLAAGVEPGQDSVFSIVVRNLGVTDVDYVVAASLTSDDGRSERVVVDVPRLQPGQEVEQFVVPGREIGQAESCSVAAVQAGNRLLLFSGR